MNAPSNNSYQDLKPNERLRILLPVFKSGKYQVTQSGEHREGNMIVLSANDLVGYETSFYRIEGTSQGRVRLKFDSAEKSIGGNPASEPSEPKLTFPLPTKAQHIRLIYLVRQSQSDHNMAITASKNLQALNVFTERLRSDPNACGREKEVFCVWVPAGMAVTQVPLFSPQ